MRARPTETDPPLAWAEYYLSLGWVLSAFAPGTKGPTGAEAAGWNTPERWIDTLPKARSTWAAHPTYGMGVIHAGSGTVAIDVDDVERTRAIFAEFGLDLERLLTGAPRIRGRKSGRDKAIFRAPSGEPLPMHKVAWKHPSDPTQSVTLFEFRSGPVHDVLPPSQHPDGHRYAWRTAPWELAAIPELPRDLHEFWRAVPELRPQIAAMAPWAPPVVTPTLQLLPSAPAQGHNDVIGAYNRTHSVHALLTAHGYVKKGARYLAPSSTSRIPGVSVLPDGRVYSHHGSDPLADGHAHDAFDLFTRFEHGGDRSAAVSAASRALDLPVYGAPAPRIDTVALLSARRDETRDVPADLLSPPGVLADIARYGLAASVRPVPVFAVQAALALGSVVCARRFVTSMRNYASCYFLNVAKSGTGKEEAKTTIEAILNAAGAAKLLGPAKYSSGNAVYSALLAKPQHIAIVDEFGKYLESAAAARDNFRAEALTMLMETFGRLHADLNTPQFSTMTMRPSQAAEMEPKVVSRPAVTLLGMTTPSTFYGALSSKRVLDGFLNRFIVVEHTGARQPSADWTPVEVPTVITQWVQQLLEPRGNLDTLTRQSQLPEPVLVELTGAAQRRMRTFERGMLEYSETLDADGFGDMPIRANEIALRVGLIAAMADTPDTPRLTDDVLDWACRYVEFYLRQTVAALHGRLANSEVERVRNDILAAVTRCGPAGVTDFEMHRSKAFTCYSARDREEALRGLRRGGLIELVHVNAGARGRPRHAWVALDPDAAPQEAAS